MAIIHWFRRDLRLHDNPALSEAAARGAGQVIPLFIIDDAILRASTTGAARVAFMLDALRDLDARLRERGSRLVVRRGNPLNILREMARDGEISAISWNHDYTPFARRRDREVAALLQALAIEPLTSTDALIVEPEAILSGEGRPYTVFTPYRKRWRALVEQQAARLTRELPPPRLKPIPARIDSLAIPTAADLGFTTTQVLPPGGETAGSARLAEFAALTADGAIAGYAQGRDILAAPATSRLSAYLRFGCVAPRAALRAALHALGQLEPDTLTAAGASIETWMSELAWRDFYYQIMWHHPHVLRGAFKPQYNALKWGNNPAWFAAWRAGRTGYPVVDAAMRQLQQEGWMHNRARMIVASFLTKDLLIDWRWGERYFMQQLVDGDHAANNGGWQWSAGTGTDAQPYFRIFNPVSQGQKFDPQGEYVRRYLPELAAIPPRYIHAPWTMPEAERRRAGIGDDQAYPLPIVEHAIQRERALSLYRAISSVAL